MHNKIRRVCSMLFVSYDLILVGSRNKKVIKCRMVAFYCLWNEYTSVEIRDTLYELPGFGRNNILKMKKVSDRIRVYDFSEELKLAAKEFGIKKFYIRKGLVPRDIYNKELDDIING